jgi:hypothetical protein
MARIANPFRYSFHDNYKSGMSVYKLFFGVTVMEVHLVCQVETALDLLICEHRALQACKGDPLCLNVSTDQSLPAWIPQEEVKAFMAWMAQNNKPKNRRRVKSKVPKTKDAKAVAKGNDSRKTGMGNGRRNQNKLREVSKQSRSLKEKSAAHRGK